MTLSDYRIAMITDSFYPKMGGIEVHVYSLAQCLLRMHKKVIVITRQTKNCKGVRFMKGGLKVYYLPTFTRYPDFISSMAILRHIILHEKINIVHAHSEMYHMGVEAAMLSNLLKIHAVITLHSLFGLSTEKTILLNYFFTSIHRSFTHYICVSRATMKNLLMRYPEAKKVDSCGKVSNISVIPNALCTSLFKPIIRHENSEISLPKVISNNKSKDCFKKCVTIVIITRLEYRKGIMLVPGILKNICKDPNVKVIIGGGGTKRIYLEEFREEYNLHDRVEILGVLQNENVGQVLSRGDIFLNTSLTESFCIAILEAAACGLYVVSTDVGGIPEVATSFPDNVIKLTKPTVQHLTQSLLVAINYIRNTPVKQLELNRWKQHNVVKNTYNWMSVARQTCKMYATVLNKSTPSTRYLLEGLWLNVKFPLNIFFFVYGVVHYLMFLFINWCSPKRRIHTAPVSNFLRNG